MAALMAIHSVASTAETKAVQMAYSKAVSSVAKSAASKVDKMD